MDPRINTALRAIASALAVNDHDTARRQYLAAVDALIAELETVDDSALRSVQVGEPVTFVWRKLLERDRRWVEQHGITDGAFRNLTAIARQHTELLGIDPENPC